MENIELQLAWDFINKTNRNVFLTGKAGTGKTTFLHKLKLQSHKRMVIVAPTGVAAINANGVTIHSFFQMPFGPILPNTDLLVSSDFNRKFSKTKIKIIKSLDLLVIDEISMVRADLLDGIDRTLRRFKNKNTVFGGVQLLMIGDLQQLSPIIKEGEWHLLKPFYNNAYFFSSIAYQKSRAITIELKHIYRQDNPLFINILNQVRNNELSLASIHELNKRYKPDFIPIEKEGYITLTTHNHKANQTNNEELKKIDGKAQTYEALIKGKFPNHSFPNEEELVLKIGAQVMFVKNDSAEEKRYFNGKIGKIIDLDEDEVIVSCPGDDFNIITKPEIWENIKYNIDPQSKEIKEDKIGSYTQMPLRLAWSITIHKSQGLTFEKAIIDTEGAFTHGQTYVALSRCKSLEGLVLRSKITSKQIINDINISAFNKETEANQPDKSILQQSKREFQLSLISNVFSYYKFLHPIGRVLDIYFKNRGSIEGALEKPLSIIKENVTNLLKVGNGFETELDRLIEKEDIPEDNETLQNRFAKALEYFKDQTESIIKPSFKALNFTTDNKAIQKDIEKQLDTLNELLESKLSYFGGLNDGFNSDKFLELRAKSVFLGKEKPKRQRKTVIEGTANVELFELLRELRNHIAKREELVHFQIFTQKSLYAMCETLPTSKQELKQIHGMGKTRVQKYGKDILKVIIDYCNDNDIEPNNKLSVFEVLKPKKQKGDTKKISLELFKKGNPIDQIALERELNPNTIFGHLASFIPTGEVSITDLMPQDHYNELMKIIPTKTFDSLSDLKHQIDDKYSYAGIRLILDILSN